MLWSSLEKIGIKGTKPWLSPKTAKILTFFCLIFIGFFYFPILQGIFLGLKSLLIPGFLAICLYFFWSYPNQFLCILIVILTWMLIGSGIAGIWIWGATRIFSIYGNKIIFAIILTLFWTFGPVAIGKKILTRLSPLKIIKEVLRRRASN